MRAEDIKGLMEAYSKVHDTTEIFEEELAEEDLEILDEAPMTSFQAGGGQAKLNQLNKGRSPRSGRATSAQVERTGRENLYRAGGGDAAIAKGPTRSQNVRGGGTKQVPTLSRQDVINRGASAKPATPAAAPAAKPVTPAAAPAAKPAAAAAAKPAATSAAKPAATSAAKPAGSAMDQFAKANPKLAAASAERARTRGTSATTNPLMKDMKSKLPEPKPAPTLAGTVAAASKPTAFNPSTNAAASSAAKPTSSPVNRATGSKKPGSIVSGVDLFDIVKGYLIDEGYAETEESAIVIMANMSEQWRNGIIEGYQRNPEKGEKEDKKYEPVRGEKTPMPPRGDKRREDFEKWYAKNVR